MPTVLVLLPSYLKLVRQQVHLQAGVAYRVDVNADMHTRDEELLEWLQLGQVVWDRPKVEVVSRGEEERLVLSLLVVLVVASLADAVGLELDVEPPLLATRASLHLLRGKCF